MKQPKGDELEDFKAAFAEFYSRLPRKDFKWAIIGSMSQYLQGVQVIPNDIDIITSKDGALQINAEFKSIMLKKVSFSREPHIRSYFGYFNLKNIRFEIIAEIENNLGKDGWQRVEWEKHIVTFNNGWHTFPVVSLSYEHEIQRKLGFNKRADLIREVLENRNS